jgi:hypothetical protein
MHEDTNARDAREWTRLARLGDLAGAWAVSDRIRRRIDKVCDPTLPRHFQQIWDGTPLAGRHVLIRCYHGLGDTIQFVRYAPLVRASARSVAVWAQPALLPLLRRAAGIDRLLPLHDGSPEIDYDADIEVMELPYAFRTTLSTIPGNVPYLAADPRPLHGDGLRVGVAWRGGDWDGDRSIPFGDVASLFEGRGVSWYSLQRDSTAGEEHERLARPNTDGVLVTAEVMKGLDLVLSVDTMAAHLAGALAIPVWTLLPYEADWRWMAGRHDSPWYPTMRLFRQKSPGRWRPVIEHVRQALLAVLRNVDGVATVRGRRSKSTVEQANA